MKTITHLYDRYADAADAIAAVETAGIPVHDISLLTHSDADIDNEAAKLAADGNPESDGHGAGRGAGIGGVLGGGVGLLAALGLVAIPVVGPFVAAGWLFSTIVGAAAGAGMGGVVGALVEDAAVSHEDAVLYAEGVRRGGSLVAVRVADKDAVRVNGILERFHPVDLALLTQTLRTTPRPADAGERTRFGNDAPRDLESRP